MDLRKLKTLIDLVSESNISELEITEAEGKVRIVKAGVAMVALLTLVACGTGSTTSKGSVHVLAVWAAAEQDSFMATLKPFEDQTGIKVLYESTRDVDSVLATRIAAGNPPEVASLPSPRHPDQVRRTGQAGSARQRDPRHDSNELPVLAGLDQAGHYQRQALRGLLVGRRQGARLVQPDEVHR